ncbi:MAG: TVP38/TMEM64 family protein [Clostridia bacterium]|nr:TVP38/TMEM64 family protein [Clostridia bacterium]
MATKDEKKRLIYNVISAVAFVCVFAFAMIFVGPKLLQTVKEPDLFRDFINDNIVLGIFAFLLIQIFQVFFALIPGEPIEIFAGYAFGSVFGLVLCMIGVTLGAAAIFWLTRRFGKKFTYILVAEDKIQNLKFMQNEKKVELLFFLLYFIPGTPKDLITYLAGLTKINFWKFILISSFARIPSILTSTLAGSTLQNENYVLSCVIFAVTGVISVIGIIIYNKISKSKNNKNS